MRKAMIGTVLGVMMGIVIAPLLYLLTTGDFPGAQIFYGLQEDDAIVIFLLECVRCLSQ